MKLPDDVVKGTARVTLSMAGDPVGGKIDVITHPGLYDAEDKFAVSKACAEHNMMRLALLVYALEHGKSFGKLDSTQETEIKENLMTGELGDHASTYLDYSSARTLPSSRVG